MGDIFPFLMMRENTLQGKIGEIVNYLTMFKEALEFEIQNISEENLSVEFANKLNGLGADIVKESDNREDGFAQLSKNNLTIYDVCNSELFKVAVKNLMSAITFNVNFETGHLEYTIS